MKINEFRQRVHALLTEPETADLPDEEWYDRLWELLDPVIDARAERQFTAAVNSVSDRKRDAERCPVTWNPGVWPYTTRCVAEANHGPNHLDRHGHTFVEEQLPTHDADEYHDPSTGEPIDREVEAHRFSFEGSTTQLADHLVTEHGVPKEAVRQWRGGLTEGDWTALDTVHRAAHGVWWR